MSSEVVDSAERVIIGRYYPPQPTLGQKQPMFQNLRNVGTQKQKKFCFIIGANTYDNLYCETGDYWKKLSSTTNSPAKTTKSVDSFDEYYNITFVLFMIWTFLLCQISIYFQRYSLNKYSQCIRGSINQTMRQWR